MFQTTREGEREREREWRQKNMALTVPITLDHTGRNTHSESHNLFRRGFLLFSEEQFNKPANQITKADFDSQNGQMEKERKE